MKILVAADGSSFTKRVMAYITAHDEWLGPAHHYTVLTVVPSIPARASGAIDSDTLNSYYSNEGEKVLKPVRAFLSKQGIEAKYLSKVGNVHEVIAKTAQSGRFDLLLMGSHGHGNVLNLVLGSVANKVMAHCKTPVLLIR